MAATTQRLQAAWGDAEGRRRDILASAERLLEESGYAALTMRAIASGAGVSSGTVYQYFGGKDDVFVALTARRLEQVQATLRDVDREIGIAAVLREILPQVTELWRKLGRSAPQWEAKVLASGRRSKGMATSASVYQETLRTLAHTLRETAETCGQTLIDDAALPHWVWDALIGVADDLLLGGSRQGRVRTKRLIEFATQAIERSILVSG
ncbi:AcrR family transcriptional regulator [Saccharomonospora amisosensis]|uniref:AcrR family transcriptional regulator n=1 Tax=Saccharomonospora amisosensis TaxID=1128677 RepID=A0A7X5ZP63_9PSEU|nr:TetR/AcrR family transcriptional regulator [Saccharomonospora amisosensis]NIJ10407.1 AcrR family transcriptional regulator [Saccharomonospora amisosensis]